MEQPLNNNIGGPPVALEMGTAVPIDLDDGTVGNADPQVVFEALTSVAKCRGRLFFGLSLVVLILTITCG